MSSGRFGRSSLKSRPCDEVVCGATLAAFAALSLSCSRSTPRTFHRTGCFGEVSESGELHRSRSVERTASRRGGQRRRAGANPQPRRGTDLTLNWRSSFSLGSPFGAGLSEVLGRDLVEELAELLDLVLLLVRDRNAGL